MHLVASLIPLLSAHNIFLFIQHPDIVSLLLQITVVDNLNAKLHCIYSLSFTTVIDIYKSLYTTTTQIC